LPFMSGTISLCLIVGNVEEYIERCLSSFAPIADEICVVRAIGNQTPDATLDIAAQKFGAIVDVYRNHGLVHPKDGPSEEWPHIDNFAAARQKSFDLASGDYIFWVDSDDVLKCGADFVRQHAERNGYPVFMFPYDVFGRGVLLNRERMILRGAGKWRFPVHECFEFNVANVQGVEDRRVVVRHLPSTAKTGSNERNLRIMEAIPEAEMTPGLLYHLHGELLGAERHVEAVAAGERAFKHPDLGKPERYEILLNLGRVAKDARLARQYFHQAYSVDPCRREALGLLVCSALDHGLNVDALAYARQMLATNKPAEPNWNDRPAAYEWLGIEIYTQALRVNGEREEAERCRLRVLERAGGPTISLIHATRGRPRQATLARKIWLDLAERPDRVEHIFIYDADDKVSEPLVRLHGYMIPPGGGCVNAWNTGALVCRGDVLIQISDDWVPPPRWDALILERLGDLSKPSVLAVSDGHRTDALLCMAICTRAYFAEDWFLFHPDFTGVYSDNWFTREAHRRGAVIKATDLIFTHNHPILDRAVAMDETYLRQNAKERYIEGEQVFNRLLVGASWATVPGWFNYWMFYREIAKGLRDGDVVAEVGVWLGRSVIFLAQECQRLGKKVKLIAVDTFKGEENQAVHQATVALAGGSIYKSFMANLERCGVADMFEVMIGDSVEMSQDVAAGSLAFCFIDAAHDYASVRRDIKAWRPKVRAGGTFAGHDAQYEEVARAVAECVPGALTTGPVWIAPKGKKRGEILEQEDAEPQVAILSHSP
jgi:glycosyltransferase involved in cell wall biosynthesis